MIEGEKMRILTVSVLLLATLSLGACSSTKMSRTDRAILGGVIGAGAGAAVSKTANGAIFGAAAGAGIGALSY